MAGKKVRARAKTGLAAIPLDDFNKCLWHFQYEIDPKDISKLIKEYLKENFSKDEYKAILANADYHFTMWGMYGACIFYNKLNLAISASYSHWKEAVDNYYKALIEKGNAILNKEQEEDVSSPVKQSIVVSPQQRLANKVGETIFQDLYNLEEQWINGNNKATIDLYAQFKKCGLSGMAVDHVRPEIEKWLEEYTEAYKGKNDDLNEAYSHIEKPELKKRIKSCEEMLADLDKIKNAAKAVRKTRAPKPKSADTQITKIQYLKESNEYKLVSIKPIQIIGSMRLYVFNTKTRELFEYISESASGFAIKGTTLQNFSNQSRKTRLRKPEEILNIVQTKTPKQVDNVWQKLTTKTTEPNGRINSDCLLLRVLDR